MTHVLLWSSSRGFRPFHCFFLPFFFFHDTSTTEIYTLSLHDALPLACALRRLACRCWAGRVALRENRARQHLLAAPRGSEVLALAECRAVGTARPWRGIVPFTHLAREGRVTVTIGRRELLAALGGGAVAWPLAGRAQQAVPRS